jgi:hypothetical protein
MVTPGPIPPAAPDFRSAGSRQPPFLEGGPGRSAQAPVRGFQNLDRATPNNPEEVKYPYATEK